ncbi:MAG TPA: hypothetical protein G4O04_09525 [Anaerolineae bacterium]|nr:hypothetical protein [Anaerolineae bacterium]
MGGAGAAPGAPYKDRPIAATPPDQGGTWVEEGREFRTQIWDNLALPGAVPSPQQATLRVIAIYDHPWLLPTDLPWAPREVKALYQDRRPVEQIPLAAKPMVSAHRRFVWAEESRHRLPEPACRRVRSRDSRPPPCRCAPPDFGTSIQNIPLGAYAGRS